MRVIEKNACIRGIVFHDQQDRIARFDFVAVVRDLFEWTLACSDDGELLAGCWPAGRNDRRGNRSTGICDRQVQREGTADARRGSQLNFSAQQRGELTADGETKT